MTLMAGLGPTSSTARPNAGLDASADPRDEADMADHSDITHDVPPELAELRHSIDNIDAAVLHLLAERFKCTQKVGRLKARLNLPPADPVREAQQIARLRSLAVNADLAPEFAEKFLSFLTREVIRHHEIIRNSQG
jgi:chorismate mutase